MTNLVLLRHGISYTNEGRQVDSEQQILLSVRGVHATLEAAANYRITNPELHFDHVFMSPYQRAVQTGLNFLSVFENKPVDITIVDEFRERNYGFTNFINMRDLVRQHGKEAVESWDILPDAKPHPEGESMADVYQRSVEQLEAQVIPFIKTGQKALVVAHYYVLKALKSYLNGTGVAGMAAIDPRNCLPYEFTV